MVQKPESNTGHGTWSLTGDWKLETGNWEMATAPRGGIHRASITSKV